MKIVIDISEKAYNEYMNLATGRIPDYPACDIAEVLKNGKPLDDVLDKIRAEINKLPDLNPDYEMDKTIHVSKWAVHGIIDKYKTRK